MCVWRWFAVMEIQLFVILLLSSYEITVDSQTALPKHVRQQLFLVQFLLIWCSNIFLFFWPSSYGRRRRCRFWHTTLRLHSAIRRHHPPQRAVLSQICCFGSVRWCCFRSAGRCWATWCGDDLVVCWREANRILLASALSSMHIIRMPKQGKSARLDYSSEF